MAKQNQIPIGNKHYSLSKWYLDMESFSMLLPDGFFAQTPRMLNLQYPDKATRPTFRLDMFETGIRIQFEKIKLTNRLPLDNYAKELYSQLRMQSGPENLTDYQYLPLLNQSEGYYMEYEQSVTWPEMNNYTEHLCILYFLTILNNHLLRINCCIPLDRNDISWKHAVLYFMQTINPLKTGAFI